LTKKYYEEFSGKYTDSGQIGEFLVKQFYLSVESLYRNNFSSLNSVLEVGAGHGFSSERLLRMFNEDTIFQVSEFLPDLVASAKKRMPSMNIIQESIYRLNRAENSIDLIFCLEVMEHLERPEEALIELARVANQGVILSVPREPIWRILNLFRGKYISSYGNTPGHIQHWSKSSLIRLLRKYFIVLSVRTPLPWTIVALSPK